MLKTCFRHLGRGCKVLGVVGLGCLVPVVVLIVLLSSGPVSLTFLKAPLEDALSDAQGHFSVSIDQTSIAWGGWERNLDLRASGIHVKDQEGVVIVDLPEIAISFSLKAMFNGVFAIRSVDLLRPGLHVWRGRDGGLSIGLQSSMPDEAPGGEASFANQVLGNLQAAPNPDNPLSYLERIRIIDADVGFLDTETGLKARAPNARISIDRQRGRLRAGIGATVNVDGRRVWLRATALRDRDQGTTEFSVDLRSGDMAYFVVLASTAGNTEQASGRFREGGKDVDTHATLRGVFDEGKGKATVSDFRFVTGNGKAMEFPLRDDYRPTIKEMRGSLVYQLAPGQLAPRQIRLDNLEVDFGGSIAYLTAEMDFDGETPVLSGQAAVTGVDAATLKRIWPPVLVPKARDWVHQRVEKGFVPKAETQWRVRFVNGKAKPDTLRGTMTLQGVTVNYLAPLPKAVDAHGVATFDHRKMEFAIEKAQTEDGLVLRHGRVVLYNFDKKNANRVRIELGIDGDLRPALAAIAGAPLHLTRGTGLDPRQMSGKVGVDLQLDLPLVKKLKPDQVDFFVKARVDDGSWKREGWLGAFEKVAMTLEADPDDIKLSATANIGGLPVSGTWKTGKSGKKKVNTITAKVKADVARLMKVLAGDAPVLTEPYLNGPVDLQVSAAFGDGDPVKVAVDADLTEAGLWLPMIEWGKAPGKPGKLSVNIDVKNGSGFSIPSFALTSKGLKVEGAVSMDEKSGALSRVDLTRVAQGRNDFAVTVIRSNSRPWQVQVSGQALDLRAFRRSLTHGGGGSSMPPVVATLKMKRVWFRLGHGLHNVRGDLRYDGRNWQSVLIEGALNNGQATTLAIRADGSAKRMLEVRSENAGEALRVLDIYDNMVGGNLVLSGIYDDSSPVSRLKGRLLIKGFRVVKAPVLAKLLAVASLTGILESLSGDGLAFDRLDAPFVSQGDRIELMEGQAFGASLGITASGVVDNRQGAVDIQGTIVPAYMVNSILGRLPLVGAVVTGGEKGSGVFAANYSVDGTLAKPRILVNPLSALAPGFLRKLFQIK